MQSMNDEYNLHTRSPDSPRRLGMMRTILPAYLVHSILLIAAAKAETASVTTSLNPSSSSTLPSPLATTISMRPITLWDVGFSLRDEWAEFREPNKCPVPLDLLNAAGETTTAKLESDPAPDPKVEPKPEPTVEAPDPATGGEEPFVSFEEWKRIKLAEEEEEPDTGLSSSPAPVVTSTDLSRSTTQIISTSQAGSEKAALNQSEKSTSVATTQSIDNSAITSGPISFTGSVAPSSAPPAHRYNYASPDCSARIIASSPQTQHASSILHKSRDRYMLTPCKANEHWVVIELCDEIRIDSIEIAVWEFFSGVVREVRVSVGGDDESEDGVDVKEQASSWTEVGAFVGKNVRGVQTFSLAQPTSFHRFVRLDFPSFYGSEYYCPVSQLKVYGMNQMDAFKWEQKRIKADAKEKDKNREKEAEERRAKEKEAQAKKEIDEKKRQLQREKELDELEQLLHAQADRLSAPDMLEVIGGIKSISTVLDTPLLSSVMGSTEIVTSPGSAVSTTTATTTLTASLSTSMSSSSADYPATPTATTETPSSPESPAQTSAYTRSPAVRSDSSESIYAFIVRRLNALEGNSSLVSRYIEEQAKVMRHLLTRMEKNWDQWRAEWEAEDRGRWEQERMRQEDRLGKLMSQLEQQRMAIEHERKMIQSQIRLLSDELGYERRRGTAQLFITLALVIIGMATRSSTIDAVLKPLLAEARRKRSIYRKSISGPATIANGNDHAGAIESHESPVFALTHDRRGSGSSPTPRPHSSIASRKRPSTPTTLRQRRPPSLFTPTANSRSLSATEGFPPELISPRARVPLPRGPVGGRRLARSAHLHTFEADKVRDRVRQDTRQHAKSIDLGVGTGEEISPLTNSNGGIVPDPLPLNNDDRGDWGTDQDTEASASEIDDDIDVGRGASQGDKATASDSGMSSDVIAELSEIWKRDRDQ